MSLSDPSTVVLTNPPEPKLVQDDGEVSRSIASALSACRQGRTKQPVTAMWAENVSPSPLVQFSTD